MQWQQRSAHEDVINTVFKNLVEDKKFYELDHVIFEWDELVKSGNEEDVAFAGRLHRMLPPVSPHTG